MNSFQDLLINRRSVRKYLPQRVEKEKLNTILTSAIMSPASKRTNGWEFIVVEDRAVLEKISMCRPNGATFLKDAPAAIVVCATPQKSDVWFEDASIASIIIQLQAADLGLGSCWVQVYKRNYDETTTSGAYISSLLNIPEELEVLNIVALGYKDEERKPYDLEKLPYEKLHFGSF